MPSASVASAGIASFTTFDAATSAWRIIAPITTLSPSLRMPFISAMPERSTSVLGWASRIFIAATRLWPPAKGLPPDCASNAAALATESAFFSSKLYM